MADWTLIIFSSFTEMSLIVTEMSLIVTEMSSYRNVLVTEMSINEMSITEMSITKVSFTKMSWIHSFSTTVEHFS